jgi:hypothetical protein
VEYMARIYLSGVVCKSSEDCDRVRELPYRLKDLKTNGAKKLSKRKEQGVVGKKSSSDLAWSDLVDILRIDQSQLEILASNMLTTVWLT